MDNQETYNKWLTEDFILTEIDKNPSQEQRLLRLYEYLVVCGDYDDLEEDK